MGARWQGDAVRSWYAGFFEECASTVRVGLAACQLAAQASSSTAESHARQAAAPNAVAAPVQGPGLRGLRYSGYPRLPRQQNVLARLRHRAVRGRYDQDRPVHLSAPRPVSTGTALSAALG